MTATSAKSALICGISGQDGAYLARLLISKGYAVHGTARDAQMASFGHLQMFGIKSKITFHSMALNDFRSVLQVLTKAKPHEIYNLAGQSSVGLSFDQPVETLESICIGTLNLLEAIRFTGGATRLYSAGSSECFGDTGGQPACEDTAFKPRSPYAVAKATAFWEVANYREAYNLFACTGILFNHESPLRPERFVTKKIIKAACQIANGSTNKLHLGNISIARDWGSAEEYVEAMWLMLQQPQPEDYVIATGQTNTLQDFVIAVFETVGLDWTQHVVTDPTLLRPSEIMVSSGNPAKALEKLGWQANLKMSDLIKLIIAAERAK
jgi:GDPmannose 4,6-dehydratase